MNATNTTTAASVATVGKSKIIDKWTALDSAVVEQMGGQCSHNPDEIDDDEEGGEA